LLTYAGNRSNLASLGGDRALEFVQGDICDEGLVGDLFRMHDFQTVVHFAAESHVDRSIVSSQAFIRTNVQGTHALLEAARSVWKPAMQDRRFHHISTDEVYGSLGPDDPPFTETTRYDPKSPYAASKAASDFLVRSYGHTHGLPITISNSSNNYGAYQFPEKLIPLMILNALAGKPLPIYGDGLNVRDWLHVEDHCEGIALVLEKGRLKETYNIGGDQEMPNIQLVYLLCSEIDRRFASDVALAARFPACPAAAGRSCRDLISFVKDRPGHDRRYAISSEKASRELGFRVKRGLAEGIRETVAWYLSNQQWWESIQAGAYRDWLEQQYGVALN
jgi:dTDP-glucose 4,6-dehydratase